jgi:hypothetical protein
MRDVLVLHGVSAGGDDAVTGHGARLEASMLRAGASMTSKIPSVTEVRWASLAQRLTDETLRGGAIRYAAGLADGVISAAALAITVLGSAMGTVADYVADVLVYAEPASRAIILAHVGQQIDEHPGCVLVAHSLGSVIALDLIVQRLRAGQTCPVAALVTVGSPLAIDVPLIPGDAYQDRARHLPPGLPSWVDYYDQDDPIVSGSIWSDAPAQNLRRAGYPCPSLRVDTGAFVGSHLGYLDHLVIAAGVLGYALGG